jgi:MFS family permease
LIGRRLFLTGMSLAIVFSLTTWFSATAILPDLTSERELGKAGEAWLTNGVQLGFVAGTLLSSLFNLADLVRLGRLMAFSAMLAAVANLIVALDPGTFGIILARIATGFALAGVYPPVMKLVSTWYRSGRGLALGIIIGALTIGNATPHLLRSVLDGFDWRMIVVATSLLSMVASAIFLLMGKEGPYPFSRAVFEPRQIFMVLRQRSLLLANLGYFGHMWELYGMWAWVLIYARESLAAQSIQGTAASLVAFLVIAAGGLGAIAGGILADRVGRCLSTAAMMTVSGSCALLIGFAFDGPFILFIGIFLIWGFSIIGDSAQFSAAITELSDARYVGTALSLQIGLGFALTYVIIWLLPVIADLFGSWRWAFLVLVPGPAIGTLAMLLLRRRTDSARMAGGLR